MLLKKLKSSEIYASFIDIIPQKIKNEETAKQILTGNIGHLNRNYLIDIFNLVDEPYPCLNKNGKTVKSPWFGRLLKSNTGNLLDEDIVKVNIWFDILINKNYSDEKKITILLTEPNKIKGLNVGFITLMLYILDKPNYLIWFKSQHKGLGIIYPDLEEYTGKSKQYSTFNNGAKIFAKEYGFEHTELDWLFSIGLPLTSSSFQK